MSGGPVVCGALLSVASVGVRDLYLEFVRVCKLVLLALLKLPLGGHFLLNQAFLVALFLQFFLQLNKGAGPSHSPAYLMSSSAQW